MFSLKLLVLYCAIQDISKVFPKVQGKGVMVLLPKKDSSSPNGSFDSSNISNYQVVINKALHSIIFKETHKLLEEKTNKLKCGNSLKHMKKMDCPMPSRDHSKKGFLKALNAVLDVDICKGIHGVCQPVKGRMTQKEKLSCDKVDAEDTDIHNKVLEHMKKVLDASICVAVLKAVREKFLQMGLNSKSYKPDDVDIIRKFVYKQLYRDIDSSISMTIQQTLQIIYEAAHEAII